MADERDADLFVAALAREMRDGDRVFAGANQPDVFLAACLARSLWAPRLRFWASGTAHLDRVRDPAVVGRDTYDNALVGGRGSSFRQAHAFDDALRAPIAFAGGLQVDGRGNANLAGVWSDGEWRLRGPGSAGLPSLTALAKRFFVQVPIHDVRSLVEECSKVSVVGDPVQRAALGLPPASLVSVITPLATFAPSPSGLVLAEVVPGVERGALAARTGFALREAGSVGERAPLTAVEADVLRRLRADVKRNRGLSV